MLPKNPAAELWRHDRRQSLRCHRVSAAGEWRRSRIAQPILSHKYVQMNALPSQAS